MPSLYASDHPRRTGRLERLSSSRSSPPAQEVLSGHAGSSARPDEDCIGVLTRMVEGEIIPRLLLAHKEGLPPAPPLSRPLLGPEIVEDFARLVLGKDTDVLIAYVASLVQRGAPLQSIYMDLLAPTARLLGDYWVSDKCSFADVTIGLGKLQVVLHDLGRRDTQSHNVGHGRSILLATPPGEQHTFGLLVVEEMFRRAGWRTWSEAGGEPEELARMVAGQWYDMFGLSISAETHLDAAASVIASVRRSSRNRVIRVIVGGRLIGENPELAYSVGADVVASGGNEAVEAAERAVGQLEGRV
jgi:methanogenic corrinoid protein MtbC1